MSTINKKILKYSIVTGDFNNIGYTNKEAYNTIKNAKVIIFDEYINPLLIRYLVGTDLPLYKIILNGNYNERTDTINKLIVELAHFHGEVVHIRGLSYKLFNQSFESINYVKLFNIETKIINLNVFNNQMNLN